MLIRFRGRLWALFVVTAVSSWFCAPLVGETELSGGAPFLEELAGLDQSSSLELPPASESELLAPKLTEVEIPNSDVPTADSSDPIPLEPSVPIPGAPEQEIPEVLNPDPNPSPRPELEGYGTAPFLGIDDTARTVHHVTTLEDSGAGSLRACIESQGPRTCIFDTAGMIRATKEFRVVNGDLIVRGESAPSPGIAIRGSGISIEASNVLLQHLRLRIGDDPRAPCCKTKSCSAAEAPFCTADPGSRDGIRIWSRSAPLENIVVDHVSISWALDEGFSIVADQGEISNVTFSNSIVSSGLDRSIHPEALLQDDAGHSKGVFIYGQRGVRNLSFHKNLLAHNSDRNIRVRTSLSMEYLNNIVYNWGEGAGRAIELSNPLPSEHRLDIIGNLYVPGPDTLCGGVPCDLGHQLAERAAQFTLFRFGQGLNPFSTFYLSGNRGPTRSGVGQDEWDIAHRSWFDDHRLRILHHPTNRAETAVATSGTVAVISTSDLESTLLPVVGALPFDRDTVDNQVASDVLNRQGRIINCVAPNGSARCEKNAGGWPDYTSIQVLE